MSVKKSWVTKNWCFWVMVLEKALESSLDCKNKPVNPKGNQPWIFIGRTAGLKLLYLGYLMQKADTIEKYLNAGRDWRLKEKGAAEDEMVRQYHWLNGHEFEQTLVDSEGQRSLACCSPRGHRELDMTCWLNSNNSILVIFSSDVAFCGLPIGTIPL